MFFLYSSLGHPSRRFERVAKFLAFADELSDISPGLRRYWRNVP